MTGFGILLFLATAHLVFPLVLLVGLVPFHYVTLGLDRKVWILIRAQTQSDRVLTYLSDLMTKKNAAAEVRLFGLGEYLRDRRQQLSSRLRWDRYKLSREHAGFASLASMTDQIAYGAVIGGVLPDDPARQPYRRQLCRVPICGGAVSLLHVVDRLLLDDPQR